MAFLKKLWRGEVSLPITFWLFGLLGTLAFTAMKLVVFLTLLADEMIGQGSPAEILQNFNSVTFAATIWHVVPWMISLVVLEFVYFIFMSGAIWNASNTYKAAQKSNNGWPFLAKTFLVLFWLKFFLGYIM